MKKPTNVLRVHDRMSRDPFTVAPDDSLQTVVDLLRRRDIRAVPVVEMGRLIGIVTDRDLRQVAPSYPLFRDETEIRRYTENLRVTAAMTADPLRVSPDTTLVEAAKILETYRISSLPVVDGETLVGMISVTDLLRAFVEQNEQTVA
ncbi:MAG: CBS domain-containing protein [Candidatus Binatia bacterium]